MIGIQRPTSIGQYLGDGLLHCVGLLPRGFQLTKHVYVGSVSEEHVFVLSADYLLFRKFLMVTRRFAMCQSD